MLIFESLILRSQASNEPSDWWQPGYFIYYLHN